jgi:hypothetical protein
LPKNNSLIYNKQKWDIKEYAALISVIAVIFIAGFKISLLFSDVGDLRNKVEIQKDDIDNLKSGLDSLKWQIWQKVNNYQDSSFKSRVDNDAKEMWIRRKMLERTGDTRITFNLEKDFPPEYRILYNQFEQEYIRLFG